MQQQGRLTISSGTRGGQVPKKDYDGNIYGWEYDLIPTGQYTAKVIDPTQAERQAIEKTLMPGHKRGIHAALEKLAQIKPIGSSDAKQATVISYLVYDLYQDGISEFVVNELCAEYRKKPVHQPKDRFFPDHGDFLLEANYRMNKYKSVLTAVIESQKP